MARHAFGPGSPTHAFHRVTHYRQTHSRAGIIIRDVKPLEDVEDPVVVLHVKAAAIIPYRQQAAFRAFLRADFDTWLGDVAGELNGIVEIVSERLRETTGIGHSLSLI